MINAIAVLPNIESERIVSSRNQPCLDVRYSEPNRPGILQAVCFDEATAAVLEERVINDGQLAFRSSVTQRSVVPTVPADVRANASEQADG